MKNLAKSLLATVAVIVIALLGVVVGALFVKLCISHGPVAFFGAVFAGMWAFIHYDMKASG